MRVDVARHFPINTRVNIHALSRVVGTHCGYGFSIQCDHSRAPFALKTPRGVEEGEKGARKASGKRGVVIGLQFPRAAICDGKAHEPPHSSAIRRTIASYSSYDNGQRR